VNDVHLVIEVRQSSIGIIEFKLAVDRYFIPVHDGRGQVGADDFHMGVLVGHRSDPDESRVRKSGNEERGGYQIPLPPPEAERVILARDFKVRIMRRGC
jgi:hypothetical protein